MKNRIIFFREILLIAMFLISCSFQREQEDLQVKAHTNHFGIL